MASFSVTYAQTLFRYPLYVFERIINSLEMWGVFLSAFVFVIIMVKVVQRFTSK